MDCTNLTHRTWEVCAAQQSTSNLTVTCCVYHISYFIISFFILYHISGQLTACLLHFHGQCLTNTSPPESHFKCHRYFILDQLVDFKFGYTRNAPWPCNHYTVARWMWDPSNRDCVWPTPYGFGFVKQTLILFQYALLFSVCRPHLLCFSGQILFAVGGNEDVISILGASNHLPIKNVCQETVWQTHWLFLLSIPASHCENRQADLTFLIQRKMLNT